ncbi:MAG: hypothetical protein JO316_19910 [Abitibacteriaceae bacterium]|nr:hypothetical protein [Abditibacteriaceae bacterium]MBV9867623.1 hypothetical protein [Abditibacteriaceae bacterium]
MHQVKRNAFYSFAVFTIAATASAPICSGKKRRLQPIDALHNTTFPAVKPTTPPKYVRYQLFIPTYDGRLIKRIETDHHKLLTHEVLSGSAFEWSEEAATEALKRLFKIAPGKFPPNTKLTSGVRDVGGYPTVSFNQAFANSAWWRHTKRGQAALNAIVRTAVATKEGVWTSSDESSLTILVKGKPVKRLGSLT